MDAKPADREAQAPLNLLFVQVPAIFQRPLLEAAGPSVTALALDGLHAAAGAIRRGAPDVVLLGWRSGSHPSIREVRFLCAEAGSRPVVVISDDHDGADAMQLILAGVRAVLSERDTEPQQILDVIQLLRRHPVVVGNLATLGTARTYLERRLPAPGLLPPITAEELTALRALVQCATEDAAAEEVGVSTRTLQRRLEGVKKKLSVQSLLTLGVLAERLGLLDGVEIGRGAAREPAA